MAARKDPAGLSGEVLINGAPQPPNFKCLSGYVVQVGESSQEARATEASWKCFSIQECSLEGKEETACNNTAGFFGQISLNKLF